MSGKTALLFPGQGSQYVGMGLELAQLFSLAKDLYEHADYLLGVNLSAIAWHGPAEILNDTINTQPAIFIHSMVVLKLVNLLFPSVAPAAVAGHSMGQLSALTAAGTFSFEDGLRLAKIRGGLMKQAGVLFPGGMAAVIGLEIPAIEEICQSASQNGDTIQVANDNCPGQVVISGTINALDRALPLLQQAGARRAIRLEVSIAAHSHLMRHAQDDFVRKINEIPTNDPLIPIIGNVTAQPLRTANAIQQDLRDQLTHRVRWTESILKLQAMGIEQFIEVGPGSVLSGLVKRIIPGSPVISLDTPRDLEKLHSIL